MKTMDDSKLTPEQYKVLREKGTEAPFSGKYVTATGEGMYACVSCGQTLFSTESQYESTLPGLQGWPSFGDLATNTAVKLAGDTTHGMHRTEVLCSKCGGHLGHLFDDHTSPTGKHYCINSCVLDFKPNEKK